MAVQVTIKYEYQLGCSRLANFVKANDYNLHFELIVSLLEGKGTFIVVMPAAWGRYKPIFDG